MPLCSQIILFEVLEGTSSRLLGDLFHVLLLGGTFCSLVSILCLFWSPLAPKMDPLGHLGGPKNSFCLVFEVLLSLGVPNGAKKPSQGSPGTLKGAKNDPTGTKIFEKWSTSLNIGQKN